MRFLFYFPLLIVNSIEIKHFYNYTFGAEVMNFNLESISNDEFDMIHTALLTRKVVILRKQHSVDVERLRYFASRFGRLQVHVESSAHYPGYNDINIVSNISFTICL